MEEKLQGGYKMLIELRPCIVDDHKALFHGWTEKEYVVEASPLIGGAHAGQIKYLYGVVEYEDGTVHMCVPSQIQFVDNKISEYAFPHPEGASND